MIEQSALAISFGQFGPVPSGAAAARSDSEDYSEKRGRRQPKMKL